MGVVNADEYDQELARRLLEHSVPPSVLRERIRQLEKQCEVLAAEVGRMRPVVDAAVAWNHRHQMRKSDSLTASDNLARHITTYEASKPK